MLNVILEYLSTSKILSKLSTDLICIGESSEYGL